MAFQEEHRHFTRALAPAGVSLTLRREDAAGESLRLNCRDLSKAGLGVVFPYSISPDTDVELWVDLPHRNHPLHLYGTVAWCAAPDGDWQAGIALNLERSDGDAWAAQFDDHDLPRL